MVRCPPCLLAGVACFCAVHHRAAELFGEICRENGLDHLRTLPRSPATTGKIERSHRTLRAEFDTRRVFSSLKTAQQALD